MLYWETKRKFFMGWNRKNAIRSGVRCISGDMPHLSSDMWIGCSSVNYSLIVAACIHKMQALPLFWWWLTAFYLSTVIRTNLSISGRGTGAACILWIHPTPAIWPHFTRCYGFFQFFPISLGIFCGDEAVSFIINTILLLCWTVYSTIFMSYLFIIEFF